MVLYYAMGGGLGHLARASAFLDNRDIRDFKIITASLHAPKFFNSDRLVHIPAEFERHPESLTVYLQGIISGYGAQIIYIDTFSHGILGELNGIDWSGAELNYVTRRLRWEAYSNKARNNIEFRNAFLLEPPEPRHLDFIGNSSAGIHRTGLRYPGHDLDSEHPLIRITGRKKWVIIHSGPEEEVNFLLDRAMTDSKEEKEEPVFFLITQVKGPPVHPAIVMDLCPAHGYLPFADRIYSGCGFNIMNQARPFRNKQHYFPFKRKYDDQYWRAESVKDSRY